MSALLLVLLGLPVSIAVTLPAFGARVNYPAWLDVSTARVVLGVALVLLLRLGAWRLSMESRGSAVMLAAFVCTLLSVLLLLFPALLEAQPLLAGGQGWLSEIATLLFAWGILISGLAPPWVGWTGIASAVLSVFVSLTVRLRWFEVAGSLRAASAVLVLVFLTSVGLALLSTASARRTSASSRTPQA